ncbi:hypothetical protein [Streptomyces sp. 150FB]|nr:hypothetical protein [Streptomyces sp. 150FB]
MPIRSSVPAGAPSGSEWDFDAAEVAAVRRFLQGVRQAVTLEEPRGR